jgi:hypothetical protein
MIVHTLPAELMNLALIILNHSVIFDELLMFGARGCDRRLRHKHLALTIRLDLHQLADDDHQCQVGEIFENFIAFQIGTPKHQFLRHDVVVPHFPKVVFIKNCNFCRDLRHEPSLKRVENLALIL